MKRNLDDQAKIFSLSYNKKDTSIFRLTATLTDNIEEKYLQQAVNRTLKTYKEFKVKLSKNLFWYYLEGNNQELPIHKNIDYKFECINTKDNNDYLLRISYHNNLLVLDFFHLLTDGATGKCFLTELLYNYLRLIDHKLKPQEKITTICENAYTKYYTKKHNRAYNPPQSYQLQGGYTKSKEVSFTEFYIKLDELKRLSKEKECSLSVLLISLIVYSLYESNYKKHNGTKPINVCIPINLRKYFNSNTTSNFVSHSMLSINPTNIESLDNIISLIKEDYTNKLTEEKIRDTFESNGKSINNKLLDFIPLPIKRFIVILGSKVVKKTFTITFSNLGTFDIEEEYSKYIKNTTFKLIPDWAERIRCGILSYKDDLIISFGSNMISKEVETKFKETLTKLNITSTTNNNKFD